MHSIINEGRALLRTNAMVPVTLLAHGCVLKAGLLAMLSKNGFQREAQNESGCQSTPKMELIYAVEDWSCGRSCADKQPLTCGVPSCSFDPMKPFIIASG